MYEYFFAMVNDPEASLASVTPVDSIFLNSLESFELRASQDIN